MSCSWTQTISYIKNNLSLPSGSFEDTDQQVKDYLKDTALFEFSTFFPGEGRVEIIPDNTSTKVSGKQNWFYIFDSENDPIISIKNVIFPLDGDVLASRPVQGVWSFGGMENFALQNYKAGLYQRYSPFTKSFHFHEPNIIEILPEVSDSASFVVEYEKVQNKDLSCIPTALSILFMDLCLGHYMIKIGHLRSIFGDDNISTAFGPIPLKGEQLLQRGTEIREKCVEKMKEEQVPTGILYIL